MIFASILIKNIWRNKVRTLLTLLGISIGIATIVVFGLAISGLKDTVGQMTTSGEIDFSIGKSGSSDMLTSLISTDKINDIEHIEGVDRAIPYLMSMVASENNPYFLLAGLRQEDLIVAGVHIYTGNPYANTDEIIVGKIAAENRGIHVGDEFELQQKKYLVTGIYESGVASQDSGAITHIAEVQRMQNVGDKMTMAMVKIAADYDVREVANTVERSDDEFVAIVDAEDMRAIDQGWEALDAITSIVSLLAIIIGGIGVMNTIMMSVFERTREIGVLRAIGWRRSRVVCMILGESLIIGILSSLLGIIFGVALLWLLLQSELGQSWIVINYEPTIFIQAVLVSLAVVIVGGVYPSYKASTLQPTESLRYE